MPATGPKAEVNKKEATFLVLAELVLGRVHYELDRSARRPVRHRIKPERGSRIVSIGRSPTGRHGVPNDTRRVGFESGSSRDREFRSYLSRRL